MVHIHFISDQDGNPASLQTQNYQKEDEEVHSSSK